MEHPPIVKRLSISPTTSYHRIRAGPSLPDGNHRPIEAGSLHLCMRTMWLRRVASKCD
jgi:hypothetical protein